MNEARLALSRCDELEELIHKKSKSGGGVSYTPKADLQKVLFNDATNVGNISIVTDGFDFGAGAVAFYIEGTLISTAATNYTIKIFVNGYLNREFYVTTNDLSHYCKFMISTCIYHKKNFVKIDIIPEITESNTISATGFCLYTKTATNIMPAFYQIDELHKKDTKIKFSVVNGVDLDGIYQQKYAYGVVNDDGLYVGECDRSNFAFENSSLCTLIDTYIDKGYDYTVNYTILPPTDTTELCYRNLVAYYSDSTKTSNLSYKNISVNTAVYTMFAMWNNVYATPALDPTKKSYAKVFSNSSTAVRFAYIKTNTALNTAYSLYTTDAFYNFSDGIIPIARNLNQVVLSIPCFLLKEGVLYFFLEQFLTAPAEVTNINDEIENMTHAVFGKDDGSEILIYYKSKGFLKCYHIKKIDTGYYEGDYFETIAYGIDEYFPLIDNDAAFVYGDKIFYTQNAEEICINT